MSVEKSFAISYGKMCIPIYRVYAHPLQGIAPIPESQCVGRSNILFAYEVDVEVFGNNFLPAYTRGDNTNLVATDSMKNFVLQQALTFEGSTLEEFLDLLGRRFLSTYAQMEGLRLTGRELPFSTIPIPGPSLAKFEESNVLFSRAYSDYAFATLSFTRVQGQPDLTEHRCGRLGMELFKVTGSAFSHFVRDEYTTLQERVDRPLFIAMDVYWMYKDAKLMLASDHQQYIPAEQIRDLVQTIFHEFVSESIQHLIHEMGIRILECFPQLEEITFEAQNRTRDLVAVSTTDEKVKVYSDPVSAYGLIKLTVNRNS
jgi:urate oxidase